MRTLILILEFKGLIVFTQQVKILVIPLLATYKLFSYMYTIF